LGASILAAVAVSAACGTFSAEEPPETDGGVGDAGSSAPVDAAADGAAPSDGGSDSGGPCRGAFASTSRVIATGSFGSSIVSVRGTSPGKFLVSWDKSPDDTLASAELVGDVLELSSNNLVAALPQGAPVDDNHATAPRDLSYVLFASNRATLVDGGVAGIFRLWISSFGAAGYPAPTYVEVGGGIGITDPVEQPYAVGNRVYFAAKLGIRVGTLTTRRLTSDLVPGVGLATVSHPVVTEDELEIFVQNAEGVKHATRAAPAADFVLAPGAIGATGDYPTWITPDACQLWVVHETGSGREVQVFDRAKN